MKSVNYVFIKLVSNIFIVLKELELSDEDIDDVFGE